MSMPAMGFPAATAVVTRLRGGGRDKHGDPIPESEDPLPGATIAPRRSTDPTDRSDAPVTGTVLRVPGDPGLRSTDRIKVYPPHPYAGTWAIEGEPAVLASPFSGWQPGTSVTLRRED